MALETLSDLYVEELKDLYSAENQILKALPKMIKAATNPELKKAFTDHLGQTKAEFIEAFLVWEEDEHQYRTKTMPCPLLGEDNKCTVYDVRPETCKGYPYTDKKEFVFHTMSRAASALVCPAAFAIIEEMKERIR